MYTLHVRLLALLCAGLIACGPSAYGRASTVISYRDAGSEAAQALIVDYYDGAGRWRECDARSCKVANSDWGTDAATDALYLRWSATGDPRARAILQSLIPTSLAYPEPCEGHACGYWSDTAAWDAVTLTRIFQATGDAKALSRAEAAYHFVVDAKAYEAGACPSVPFQQPAASGSMVKTLETLANEIKASLLLYRVTGNAHYAAEARSRYADARNYFFDDATQLYT